MSKHLSTTITLPIERALQLRAIAAAHGMSLIEVICKHIDSEIRAGVIPDEIPGFRIEIVNGLIEFEIQGKTIALTTREASQIADSFEEDEPYCYLQLEKSDLLFQVNRRGRGLIARFVLNNKRNWTRQSLSRSTARDLARLLRTVLKQ